MERNSKFFWSGNSFQVDYERKNVIDRILKRVQYWYKNLIAAKCKFAPRSSLLIWESKSLNKEFSHYSRLGDGFKWPARIFDWRFPLSIVSCHYIWIKQQIDQQRYQWETLSVLFCFQNNRIRKKGSTKTHKKVARSQTTVKWGRRTTRRTAQWDNITFLSRTCFLYFDFSYETSSINFRTFDL